MSDTRFLLKFGLIAGTAGSAVSAVWGVVKDVIVQNYLTRPVTDDIWSGIKGSLLSSSIPNWLVALVALSAIAALVVWWRGRPEDSSQLKEALTQAEASVRDLSAKHTQVSERLKSVLEIEEHRTQEKEKLENVIESLQVEAAQQLHELESAKIDSENEADFLRQQLLLAKNEAKAVKERMTQKEALQRILKRGREARKTPISSGVHPRFQKLTKLELKVLDVCIQIAKGHLDIRPSEVHKVVPSTYEEIVKCLKGLAEKGALEMVEDDLISECYVVTPLGKELIPF